MVQNINPLNAELNPTCHLLVLLGAHPILHISRIRVNLYALQLRRFGINVKEIYVFMASCKVEIF